VSGVGESIQGDDSGTAPLRILCIADEFPWPERTGYRIRLANVLRGLAEVGSLDLVILHPGDDDEFRVTESVIGPDRGQAQKYRAPMGEPVGQTTVAHVPIPRASLRGVIPWIASGLPRRVAWRDWSGARSEVLKELSKGYDLIWWSHLDAWAAIGEVADAPCIVDLDNLEDQKMLTSRMAQERPSLRDVKGLLRFAIIRELDRVDIRRWRRTQRRASLQTDGVIVCSQQDRAVLGGEKTYVIENGYVTPDKSVGHPEAPVDETGGTVVFVGLQTYEPNIDGSRFLVEQILPILQESRPEILIRIVGRAGPEVHKLARPNVKIVGEVESIEAELASADLAVVPLRIGAGTRIKILEALAHRLPIVTTNLGCEGLSLVGGVHCEIADSAKAFAESCDLLLGDAGKRIEMTDAGAALQLEHFDWVKIRSRIGDLAQTLGGRDVKR
jgi:glycosyltransferase involved in cell wall biosynthesis